MSFFMWWRKCAKIWIIWKSGKLDFVTMLEKLRILPTNCNWNEMTGSFAVYLQQNWQKEPNVSRF